MAIYSKDSKLSDALLSYPTLLPVVDRLGIHLGVEDKTIKEICLKDNIEVDFFLSIINTFIDEDYFPQRASSIFSLDKTIDYLEKTDAYYQNIQLPNIVNHFERLLKISGENNNLAFIKNFFEDIRKELSSLILYEKEELFPSLLNQNSKDFSEPRLIEGYLEIEDKLHDLLTFFIVHLKGEYNVNLSIAVVSGIFMLHKDIHENNRIRKRILLPLIEQVAHSRHIK